MNKSSLFALLVFICLGFAINTVTAQALDQPCSCKTRAFVRCGVGASDEASKCRSEFIDRCNLRYSVIEKCTNQISEKCFTLKKGTREYQRCERNVAAKDCVSYLDQKTLYNCKCKKFSQALCGNCNSAAATQCRSDAFTACKKQCASKAPCNTKKRICITPPKCNCKTLSKHKCSVAKDAKACYATELTSCKKRCLAATRCYPVTCKNAGAKRCSFAVETVCEKFSSDLKQYEQCVVAKTKRCHAFELANCKKARRLYKYRTECDYTAKTSCAQYQGDAATICKSQIREKCINLKIAQRKKFIRHSSTCAKRAKLLCDAKVDCKDVQACYKQETSHCVNRKHRREYIVPEECTERVLDFCGSNEGPCYKENIKKCTEIWLRRYCERKAFKECGCDVDCMQSKIRVCNDTIPKCWHNRELCNDHNKCTIDVCDPNAGCLHIPKSCNDNNLCTKDVCDPKVGCSNTAIICDDKVACTIDSCNPENGQCQYVPDNTKCVPTEKCTHGSCTASGCKFYKDATCKRVPHDCSTCKANPCQIATCELNADFTVKCIVKDKNCNDGKKCTADSCDIATGKCVHTKIVNTVDCPKTTVLCNDTVDCSNWGLSQDLTCKCQVAVCDANLGVCVAAPTTSQTCVTCDKCKAACAPRNPCDEPTTSCTKDSQGNILCNRPAYPCDDGSVCTTDSCDVQTGKCVHTYDKCPGKQCKDYKDCIQWSIDTELYKQCKTAYCDAVKKTCIIVDQLDQNYCPHKNPVCALCVARNACETAECVLDSNDQPSCVRTQKMCDDKNVCTKDTCDAQTGKCINTPIDSPLCHRCKKDKDCAAYGKTLNLAPICKTAVCDKETHFCTVSNLPVPCKQTLCTDCIPANKCENATCVYDAQGNPSCSRSNLVCNDNDDCTTDSCDQSTGTCVFTPVNSPTCFKCQFDVDCKAWADSVKLDPCQEAYCNKHGKCGSRATRNKEKCKPTCTDCIALNLCDQASCVVTNGIATCAHTPTKCDDGNDCTQDYCDVKTGKCVFNPITSKECQQCKADMDCGQFATQHNLASKCSEAYCKNNFCKVRASKDKTNCPKPVCMDCVSTLCSSAKCIYGDDNKPTCVYTQNTCNDNNPCTTDKCDITTGDCIHTSIQSSQCQPCEATTDCTQWGVLHNLDANCQVPFCNANGVCDSQPAPETSVCTKGRCTKDADCLLWATQMKVAQQCQTAYCDTGVCKSKPINDLTICTPPPCVDCKAGPCETASCKQVDGVYFCDRSKKVCDDGIDCTTDYCDINTGNCAHTTVNCTICNVDNDCSKFAVEQKLSSCQVAKCHPSAHVCIANNIPNKVCGPFCKYQCPVADKCHEPVCHYDNNNNLICDKPTPLDCNDNNPCTQDSCDPKQGCLNPFVTSKTCVKCTKDTDCATYAINNNLDPVCLTPKCSAEGQCESVANPKCVPPTECKKACATDNKCVSYGCSYDANNKIICNYVPNSCNDGKDCTTDSCDAKTGLCIHTTRSDCGPVCTTVADCNKWAIDSQLSANCKQASCDAAQGMCVSTDVPDVTKCPVPNCDKFCPSTKCQKFTCSYDISKKVICTPQAVNCDDGDDCTTDSCDINTGCVHNFVDSDTCHKCTKTDHCSAWAAKLGPCFYVSCDATRNKCVKQPSPNNPLCKQPPIPPVCPPTCIPPTNDKCSIATLVQTADSCTCQVSKKNCDDKIGCTVDSCDASTGQCKNVFTPSPTCTVSCTVDAQCGKYAIDNKLYDNCQIAVCDTNLGTCVPQDDNKTNCKKCKLDCKPSSNCDDAQCVWIGNSYQCQHNSKNCDDGKTCTTDSCNPSTGQCSHEYNCPNPQCNTDIDCAAWGAANPQFSSNCLTPVCNTGQGSCQVIPDKSCNPICHQNSDCPPSEFGSVCDTSTNTCQHNPCQYDSDCSQTNPNLWNYCKVCSPDGLKCCVPTPKCTLDGDCDDKNPCTKDICLPEYGFCRNMPRCDDSNECTNDICTASSDGKTYTCSNPPRSCTQNATLLNSNYVLLSNAEKVEWLGKCDKKKGCIGCVVNAQCDNHQGCVTYSCQQQKDGFAYCISVPINNQWCDPKLASQPIYYQSIPGLRDQLILAGYDISKLVN